MQDGARLHYRRPDDPCSHYFPGDEVPTLADLVNRVEQARADEDAILRAFEVDPVDGDLIHIDIDWLPNAIDDEECYVIESYTPHP